jgi:hypothetical protein
MAVGVVLGAVIVTVVVYSHVESVPVKFVNDTANAIILTDCGPDLQQVQSGQTSVINVYRYTKDCTFGRLSGDQTEGGCLVMPSPLEANAVVRVSDARPISRSHPCG